MLAAIFAELGVEGVTLNMNSMGDAACRPAYVEKLRGYLRGREGELCGDCLERIDLNPLRTFDCKVQSCRAVLDEAPRIGDHLCPECREHFDAVLALVRAAGLEPNLDFRLVRGLDYYTRTTFEFNSDRLGAQSGVGGGGRYDGLVEQIGGRRRPASAGAAASSGSPWRCASPETAAGAAAPIVVAFSDEAPRPPPSASPRTCVRRAWRRTSILPDAVPRASSSRPTAAAPGGRAARPRRARPGAVRPATMGGGGGRGRRLPPASEPPSASREGGLMLRDAYPGELRGSTSVGRSGSPAGWRAAATTAA